MMRPTIWNKNFFDHVIRADIGRALKAHYDHQLEGQPLAQNLAVLIQKIERPV
jgi:hypothetical protein